jgi:type II secretory pathway pseudopilin PulG
LLVVIAIIGLLAALAAPVMRNFKPNYTASASRQLLDALTRARQLAISQRTTVYMVFVPTNFWTYTPYTQNQAWFSQMPGRATNLFNKQLIGYNFVSLRSMGDQPGRPTVKYLSSWKTLPEGAFIHPTKFRRYAPQTPVMNIWTNGVLAFQIYGMLYSDSLTNPPAANLPLPIPFPSEDAPRLGPNRPYVPVPYIAFDYMGRLVSQRDEIIPLATGGINFAHDADRNPIPALPTFSEQPVGNTTNAYNLVYVDWLTGRARAIQQEVR